MGITPQFIYGKDGLPTNVVITYEEWQRVQEQMNLETPQWQIEESMRRLAEYRANPGSAIDLDSFMRSIGDEDGQ